MLLGLVFVDLQLHELVRQELQHVAEELVACLLIKLNVIARSTSSIYRSAIAAIGRDEVSPLVVVAIHAELRECDLTKESFTLAYCTQVRLLYLLDGQSC